MNKRTTIVAALVLALGVTSGAWAIAESGQSPQVPGGSTTESRTSATLSAAQRSLAEKPDLSLDEVTLEFVVAGNEVYSSTGRTGRCILVVGVDDPSGTIRSMACAPITTDKATSIDVQGKGITTTVLWSGTGTTNLAAVGDRGEALDTRSSKRLSAVSQPGLGHGATISWHQGDRDQELEILSAAEHTRRLREAIREAPASAGPLPDPETVDLGN